MNIVSFIKKTRRQIRNFFMQSGIPVLLLKYFYKGLCATLRYEQDRSGLAKQDEIALARKNGEERESAPVVLCMWHDELFPVMHIKQNLEILCIVSGSKDGAILENTLNALGLHTATGSSRRGGLKALLSAVRLVNENKWHTCITVDGPMGPRHKAKDGAFLVAQKTGARIVPLRLIMSRSWRINSWDKFQIPLPFSKVNFFAGQGFYVTEELTEDNLIKYRSMLEEQLTKLAPSEEQGNI